MVSGFGFRVSGFGFRVSGLAFRVSGFEFRLAAREGTWQRFPLHNLFLGFRISPPSPKPLFYLLNLERDSERGGGSSHTRDRSSPGLAFRVEGWGFRERGNLAGCLEASGARVRLNGLGFRCSGIGCRVQGSGFRVQGSGSRVSGVGCRVQRKRELFRKDAGFSS